MWSVHNQAQVVFSVQKPLSVMCWYRRAQVPKGTLSAMFKNVPMSNVPSSKSSERVPEASTMTMLSTTAPSPIEVWRKPSQGEKPPSAKKATYTQCVPAP